MRVVAVFMAVDSRPDKSQARQVILSENSDSKLYNFRRKVTEQKPANDT